MRYSNNHQEKFCMKCKNFFGVRKYQMSLTYRIDKIKIQISLHNMNEWRKNTLLEKFYKMKEQIEVRSISLWGGGGVQLSNISGKGEDLLF